jgi:hypothetical protein
VPVKINAFVDEAIAPVVRALNRFPRLVTTASCEGAGGVAFQYGDTWQEMVSFCAWLAGELHQRLEEGAHISLNCGRHILTGQFHVEACVRERVVAELDAIASRWEPTSGVLEQYMEDNYA